MKNNVYHPKSISEAVDLLEEFLECDLYTQFRPEIKLPHRKGKWYRKDFLKNEKEFIEYLRGHFDILEKEIIKGIGKKKYNAKFKIK